jgi:hypothetical protein
LTEETEQEEEQKEEDQGLKHEMGGMGEAALPNASRWVQAENRPKEEKWNPSKIQLSLVIAPTDYAAFRVDIQPLISESL